jgi:phosphatidate cytidylyltransferase
MPGGVVLILLVALAISACDTGAYFSGRLIGGPKLAPHISPSKTWSGSCGGIIAAILGLLPVVTLEIYPVAMLIIGGVVIAALSQIGDLIESQLKRRLGVKDSSRLIPGHGGFLDRFDGYLTVLPVLAVLVAMGVVVLPDIDVTIIFSR